MTKIIIAFIFVLIYSSTSETPVAPFDIGPSTHELVASWDGTLSLVDKELETTLWSINTGGPIYSSYRPSQLPPDAADTTYIDCGEDWNLYRYDRSNGSILESIGRPAEFYENVGGEIDFFSRSDEDYVNETSVFSLHFSSWIRVYAHTGSGCVLDDDLSIPGSFMSCGHKLVNVNRGTTMMLITRNRYWFSAYSRATHKAIWKLRVSEFKAGDLTVHRPSIKSDPHRLSHSIYKGGSNYEA